MSSSPNLAFLDNQIKLKNIDDKLYFDDPILKFDDSMVYGCSLELTKEQLKTFCEEKAFEHLAIY